MTYDHELTLIGQVSSDNAMGDAITSKVETVILCGLKSVGRSEFYQAAVNGLKPEYIFIIHAYEYGGQKVISFEGTKYSVIRTFASSFEELEIVCTGLVNGVN